MTTAVANLLPLPKAAELIGIDRTWLWRCVQDGKLPAVTIGDRCYIDKTDALKFRRERSAKNLSE